MSGNVLETVKRCVALTASTNRNEAAEAALAACRLIREHNITLTLPTGTELADNEDLGDLLQDGLDFLFRNPKR